jgi:hypothetical protein
MDSLIGEIQRHARLLRETAEWLYPLAGNTDTSGVQAQHSGGRIEAPRAKAAAHIAGKRNAGSKPRQRKEAINRWDSGSPSSRRVPNFVQEMTGGLDTKKAIVEKFGPVQFTKGGPAPKPLAK